VILADGTVYKFRPVLTPSCQRLAPIDVATITFEQVSGPKATLELARISHRKGGGKPNPVA